MGMQKLHEISQIFVRSGKAELPAAIIQNGSLPDERIGIGTAENLPEISVKNNLSSPAVIVIGEVVSLHPDAKKIFKEELLEF
jgi:uroporphyrin-III C-methyltransferase